MAQVSQLVKDLQDPNNNIEEIISIMTYSINTMPFRTGAVSG